MMAVTLPPGFRDLEHQEFERLYGRLVWTRFAAVPLFVALLGWLAFVEPAPWRRALLLTALLFVPLFFAMELLRFRRHGLTRRALPLNLGAAVAGTTVLMFASGGLASPFVYPGLLIALLVGVFVPGRMALVLVGAQVAAVWTFAALGASGAVADFNPRVFGGGFRVGSSLVHLYLHAGVLSLALAVIAGVGRALRAAFERTMLHAAQAQQDALHAHAERTQELTALSAEIAHELKNPLASLKGLAGLLTQNLPEGKGAERLGILRGEVERMQGILEEFLHFSRPLLPLSTLPTELGLLCGQVVALHEGLAQAQQVQLVLLPGSAFVRCDPRKVKQILINLVQNALEASPPGGEVCLEVGRASEGGARVLVLDRGRGLDEALTQRLFEPGVTTKERGSGVGLTVARALARQHGGDLLLAARPGGGAIAELWLPAAPATQQEAA